MGKLDELIQAIAESGNEKVMTAFLEWQDEGIKAKERLIKKLDNLLKTSEGKVDDTIENSLHKHFVNGWPLEDFPDNLPLYLDSGLFQLRSDDMEEVLLQQGVNERNIDFLARCKAYR